MVPYLYTIVEKQRLSDMLKASTAVWSCLFRLSTTPVRFWTRRGRPPPSAACLKRYLPDSENCRDLHVSAGKRAMDLGETYIFACHASLNHIVFSTD